VDFSEIYRFFLSHAGKMAKTEKILADKWKRLGANLKKHELTLENTFQVF
jgi:hypothetical protein